MTHLSLYLYSTRRYICSRSKFVITASILRSMVGNATITVSQQTRIIHYYYLVIRAVYDFSDRDCCCFWVFIVFSDYNSHLHQADIRYYDSVC